MISLDKCSHICVVYTNVLFEAHFVGQHRHINFLDCVALDCILYVVYMFVFTGMEREAEMFCDEV